MTESFEARIAKAREHVKSISPEDIEARLASDPKTLLLDVRDEGGRVAGVIPGSTNVSLGTLFFKADQTSPYHDAETFPDLDHPIVCTCTGGGQAAVARTCSRTTATPTSPSQKVVPRAGRHPDGRSMTLSRSGRAGPSMS